MEEFNYQPNDLGAETGNDRQPNVAAGLPPAEVEAPSRMEEFAASNASIIASNYQARLRQQAHEPLRARDLLPPGVSFDALRAPSIAPLERNNVPADRRLVVRVRNRPLREANRETFIPEHSVDGDVGTVCSESNDDEVFGPSGWSQVEMAREPGGAPSIAPSPRSLHAGAVLNGAMYIFGGYDGTQRVNTFHAFSFIEKRWSPVLPSPHSPPPPSPRDRHVAFVFGNSFYVHGGFNGHSRVADMYGFDFSTMTWREINTSGMTGRVPSPRHSHSAVVYGHSLFIAFGYDGSYKSDIHEYDFVNSRWSAIAAGGRR
jgi:hypothetical protein